MQVNINDLANYFSKVNFTVIDVIKWMVPPGKKHFGAFTPPCSGLIFPLRGRARMFFDDIPYEMEPGKIFYAGPNLPLDKEVLGETEWELMIIHYEVYNNDKGFPGGLPHYQLDAVCSPRLTDLLYRLFCVSAKRDSLSVRQAKSLFLAIWDEIVTCAVNRRNEKGQDLMGQAVKYINCHYMEPLSVPKMANQYGLNSKQFAYLFKKFIGKGPNEYVIECRVRRARELLCTTDCSVADISLCVGYSDPYYFSKLFKKHTGVCPIQCRAFREREDRII
ncbi:AraC family transcriptional regulator [Sporomusa sp. KB1]|jgi:AraC-like DNA-binding protein|uniref:AraC family transcriptional regulator n=1 Tax=Sporomusa sp. KB1 TaxID=943346 RepID=UPI0011A9F70B|nr:AraC family transcriptional regulator [Sporomusa sp. KB1]TWH47350.1 AraC-like DNA-binding protein [Sporomusa sp. KB1]